MASKAIVAGVGMIPFAKPGASAPYHEMGAQAARLALADAGLSYDAIEQGYVGYVYGDSTCGQRALYRLGLTGVPIVNVNNNCSTGSTALFLARQAVASGAADCTLALGFEQMKPGALGLAQCYELTRQLHGTAGPTQVEGVRHALQHNLGLGGACVVTMYERA